MFRRQDKNQLSFVEPNRRFVVLINPENRWAKLSDMMPWDKIDEHYAENMCESNGRFGLPSRMAFGAIFAKEDLNLTDEGMVTAISENVYLQYFLGMHDYQDTPLFDSSMMVHFRKRFSAEFITKVNEYICTGKWPDDNNSIQSPDELPPPEEVEHKGRLTLDATVAPSDIRHPNDVSLLHQCRVNLEELIDSILGAGFAVGNKTQYNRHSAHRKYINFIKKKKKTKAKIKAALESQLNYLKMAIEQLEEHMLINGMEIIRDHEWDLIDTICRIYLQQEYMLKNGVCSCESKIMSLRQPFVRAIYRNKARTKYEYGQKLALSKANGFVFVEQQAWENFNECNTLQQSVLNHYNRFGYYPAVVLADQIYQTKANMKFCESLKIKLSGAGCKKKDADQAEKEQAYKDVCARNEIEGVNGVLKRRYGMDLIMCWDKHNAEVEVNLQILAMNLQRRFRLFLPFFAKWIYMVTSKSSLKFFSRPYVASQ